MRPHLLTIFPTFAVGGAQSRFTALANYLGAEWDHSIVSMDGVTTARERLDSNVTARFPEIRFRKGDLGGNIKAFRSAIRALAPTTMLTHNFGSIEWALANRMRLVNHVHAEDGFGPEERDRQLPRRIWLRRFALFDRSVVLPSTTLLDIATHTWKLNQKRLSYIPNGVDLRRFEGVFEPSTQSSDHESQPPVVGTVAALRPEKNIGRLIRAFHIVASQAEARLSIVGDGPQRGELEELVDGLGLRDRVRFAGHVAKPDDLIKSFDIFAISSDTEQMPISLLEAMAAGKPTAATDVGDIAQMLPLDGRAFVTPCDDHKLAEALLTLVKSSSLRRSLGRSARTKVASDFDQIQMFKRWAEVLHTGDQF